MEYNEVILVKTKKKDELCNACVFNVPKREEEARCCKPNVPSLSCTYGEELEHYELKNKEWESYGKKI